jgi:hypothetical protein
MTFENAAWAIDGAQMNSALARRAMYAGSRQSGIVQKSDLKVSPLGTPGNGVVIGSGVGLVINDYQSNPNEMYVVSNPGAHTVPSVSMPPSTPAPKSWIVAIVIGDPDFSQTGHPWMGPTDPPSGEELTFQYVRPTLIEVDAGATSLDVDYPALVLARIDIPASTTTITSGMIHDLRELSMSRQSQTALVSAAGLWDSGVERIPSATGYNNWSTYAPTVDVPSWATRAIVMAHINGVRLQDTSENVVGKIRVKLGSVSGPDTNFDYSTGGGPIRDNLMSGGKFTDVTGIAGTTVAVRMEGYESAPAAPSNNQKLTLTTGSQIIFDIRFFEE